MYVPREIDHQWDGVDDLIVAVMRRAVADAMQGADLALARDAWEFLEICAPTVAEELRRQVHRVNPKARATRQEFGKKRLRSATPG